MLDGAEEVREILCNTIKNGTKEDFREGIAVIADYETTESGKRRVREAGDYFLSNWSAAQIRLSNRNNAGIDAAISFKCTCNIWFSFASNNFIWFFR